MLRRAPHSMSAPALALAGASLVMLSAAPQPAVAAEADQNPAATTSGALRQAFGSDFNLSEAQREFTATVDVPPGLEPSAFAVKVDSRSDAKGDLIISANGSERVRRKANVDGVVVVPLKPGDVDNNQQVNIAFEWPKLPSDVKCKQEVVPTLRFTDGNTVFTGTRTAPDSVGAFFGRSVQKVALLVSPDPSPEEATALFAASSAVASIYGRSAAFAVSTVAPKPDASGLTRVITVKVDDQKGSVTRLTEVNGNPALEISGGATAVQDAAAGLSSDALGLASTDEVKDLRGGVPVKQPLGVRTFIDLGQRQVRLSGVGEVSRNIGLSQATFGAPISGVRLHLTGHHTPVAEGTVSNLNVIWNDTLISSRALEPNSDTVTIDVEVPPSNIARDNTLTLQLQASPRKGGSDVGCPPDELPTTFDLDTKESTVDPQGGQSLQPGFDRFPQTLLGELPVALGGGASVLENTLSGAHLVHALQVLNPAQLRIRGLSPDELLNSQNSGLLLGATDENLTQLGASLLLQPFRTIDSVNLTYNGEVNAPFAAIQALENNERDVIALGSYRPNGQENIAKTLERRLAAESDADPNGFFNLSGSIDVAQQGKKTISLEASAISAQTAAKANKESAGIPGWSIPLTLAVLAGFGLWRWIVFRRRMQREAQAGLDELTDGTKETVGSGEADDRRNP